MSQPTPEPVLDERGRIDAATSVEAIIAKGWMRFPHDPPHPDSFALADAAITAYQSATGDALTEAEHRAERLQRVYDVGRKMQVKSRKMLLDSHDWMELADALNAVDRTTDGPGGTQ